jgi:hypothetical protein
MSSLPTCVEEGFKTFFKILYYAYEMKSYKPTTLQPSLNVKQVVKIRQDLKLEKFVIEAQYVQEL